jgi:LysM repeat protein
MARIFIASIALCILGLGNSVAEGRTPAVHQVESGQTLWGISRTYGCDVEQIKEANRLADSLIRPGQKLEIPRCKSQSRSAETGRSRGAGGALLIHYVMEGETLGRIANRYGTTVNDIRRRNSLDKTLIRPGQKLRIAVGQGGAGRAISGQSVGSPSSGRLVNAMQLPPGQGYYRRRPHRAWGANHTIYHIRRAVSTVRSRFPKVHNLAIGDISARKGGRLAQHKSHQSGLDADIGLYFKKQPEGYPNSFVKAHKDNLHMRATWALLKALADTAHLPSGVEKMFLDYDLQEIIYKWARKKGVAKKLLDRIFQYPHGMYATQGIIRHDPGHNGHVHVRFKCPKGDKECR